MVILTSSALILSFITIILLLLAATVAAKSWADQEKAAPFECGFTPSSSFRVPFSLHFFLVTILFLVFDVELVLLFPYLMVPGPHALINMFFSLIILLLSLGLILEWSQSMLEWADFTQSLVHFAVNKEMGDLE